MRKHTRNEDGMIHLGIGAWFLVSVLAVVFFAGIGPAITYVSTASDVVGKTAGVLVSIPGPLVSGFKESVEKAGAWKARERREERRENRPNS